MEPGHPVHRLGQSSFINEVNRKCNMGTVSNPGFIMFHGLTFAPKALL